jgi:hypothetical protein
MLVVWCLCFGFVCLGYFLFVFAAGRRLAARLLGREIIRVAGVDHGQGLCFL